MNEELKANYEEAKPSEMKSSEIKAVEVTGKYEEKPDGEDNIIFVGIKPFMNYVTGVVMQFNKGTSEVKVKARGKFISKGVDVAEVSRRKFLVEQNVSVTNVLIGSEEFENKEGKSVNVSTMEIILKKN